MNIPEKRRIYGRRLGRPLKPARQKALDDLLPQLSIPEEILAREEKKPLASLFGCVPQKTIIEIGFGDGDHLAAMLRRDPTSCFIGAEPFINGMSSLLKQIEDENLDQARIRVWMEDAIRVLNKLEDHSIDEIYVLNPDPWPKARHIKRRIINPENLDLFARLMKPGGTLIMTSDVDELAEWMTAQAVNHKDFAWTAQSQEDWQTPPSDWIETKYERKGKNAGRTQSYLIFKRTE